MNRKTRYRDEDIGEPEVIPDFLPPPDQLVFNEDTVKVTIALSRSSVDFFKQEARKHHTQYQKMIRRLLDVYATAHSKRKVTTSKEKAR
jgi:hypothetical protein